MLTFETLHSLSPTYEKLMRTKKGYRSEEYSGSGIRNLSDVIEFEISELGNTDIPNFISKYYNSNDISEESSTTEIILFLSKMLDQDPDELYCIWLTTKADCKTKYGDDIYEYIIDDSYLMPISDLDQDGILFVTSRYPGGELARERKYKRM